MIQNLGALATTDPKTGRITGVSANLPAFFETTAGEVLGRPLAELDRRLATALADVATEDPAIHQVLEYVIEKDGIPHDIVTHQHAGRRFIEFLPSPETSVAAVRRRMRLCSTARNRILASRGVEDAQNIAVEAVREILGVSRVKIYRFLPDWSGEVVAEARDPGVPSYLGLRFPDGDIPKQARRLMELVPFRAIGTVVDDPVPILALEGEARGMDLTWSILRSVSPMHTAYLRNMGVGASFTCSLMHQGKLWGLIAAHNTTPVLVPFDSWSLVQEIGLTLMLRQEQKARADAAGMISELRKIENQFAQVLRQSGDVETVIETLVPVLRDYLQADGFAFQYGSHLHTSGRTPPPDFIADLIRWTRSDDGPSDQFETTALHKLWPPAKAHMDTACGVLVQPIAVHRVCQLIWFRGPVTRTVTWAGRPDDKARTNPRGTTGILGPRNSFDCWVQERRDQSAPWLHAELETAREIFKEFLDIIAAQVLLKEENSSLREMADAAVHDLKAPLLGINWALGKFRAGTPVAQLGQTHDLAARSVRQIEDLADGLLQLAVLHDQKIQPVPVDLTAVVGEARALFAHELERISAKIETDELPTILGVPGLLTRVFANLMGNALKYRNPDVPLRISVTCTGASDGSIAIAVTDNGPGFPSDKAEEAFKPMKRLPGSIGLPGSGLGLTICRRIVELHGGAIAIDTTCASGARIVITFPEAILTSP